MCLAQRRPVYSVVDHEYDDGRTVEWKRRAQYRVNWQHKKIVHLKNSWMDGRWVPTLRVVHLTDALRRLWRESEKRYDTDRNSQRPD